MSMILDANVKSGIVVSDLRITVAGSEAAIVDGVSFSVTPGEILGLVGESGSGKTTAALALLAYLRRGLRFVGGSVEIGGVAMLQLSQDRLRQMRGRDVAYVPQDPATALHPGLKIRTQLAESFRHFPKVTEAELLALLREVHLPATAQILDAYPHQLSGGQQQRIAIAMAFASRPVAMVMDEPTTALDVTSQALVLKTVAELCARYSTATLYVTHDLAVVANLSHRVAVMYTGRIVEIGDTGVVLGRPMHPYTRALIRAIPDEDGLLALQGLPGQSPDPGARGQGCAFAPRCDMAEPACSATTPPEFVAPSGQTVCCARTDEFTGATLRAARAAGDTAIAPGSLLLNVSKLNAFHAHQVLHGVALQLHRGRCLALIGESGSGKSTLARCIAGLHAKWQGEIVFDGKDLSPEIRRRRPEQLRRIQYIFQNPFGSLNPAQTVGASVAMAARHFRRESRDEIRRSVEAIFASVGLDRRFIDRFPAALSGGQRQRVAIARALICDPELLICDEVTSALDVSIQAMIVELLEQWRRERNLTILFVGHNIGLIRHIADDVVVMQRGRVAEAGISRDVFRNPESPETRRLIRDTPRFAPGNFPAQQHHLQLESNAS